MCTLLSITTSAVVAVAFAVVHLVVVAAVASAVGHLVVVVAEAVQELLAAAVPAAYHMDSNILAVYKTRPKLQSSPVGKWQSVLSDPGSLYSLQKTKIQQIRIRIFNDILSRQQSSFHFVSFKNSCTTETMVSHYMQQ